MPQYFVPITVVPLPLTEPDKRLSHTSGSSVSHSVGLRSTTRVQVFADTHSGPFRPGQSPLIVLPGVCLALALTVEPFEQNAPGTIDIVAAPLRVIRYGIVTQVADHTGPRLPDHLSFPQHMPRLAGPVFELTQTLAKLLAGGVTFHLEVPFPGLPTVMGQAQEGKLFGLPAAPLRLFSGIAPKLDALGLLFGQLQPESFEPLPEPLFKPLRIILVLKTGQKVVREAEVIRFASTLPAG